MTSTCETDLDRVKINHYAKYLGQRSFRYSQHTHAHTTARVLNLDHKVMIAVAKR